MRDRDLAAVGERRFQCRGALPLDHRNLVPALAKKPGGRGSDHARAEDENGPRGRPTRIRDRHAGAKQIAIAVHIVGRPTRPYFVQFHAGQRMGGLLATVAMLPFVGSTPPRWGAFRRVVFAIHAAVFDGANLLANGQLASTKRSSSALDSLSVGSIISVPATGKLMVGA